MEFILRTWWIYGQAHNHVTIWSIFSNDQLFNTFLLTIFDKLQFLECIFSNYFPGIQQQNTILFLSEKSFLKWAQKLDIRDLMFWNISALNFPNWNKLKIFFCGMVQRNLAAKRRVAVSLLHRQTGFNGAMSDMTILCALLKKPLAFMNKGSSAHVGHRLNLVTDKKRPKNSSIICNLWPRLYFFWNVWNSKLKRIFSRKIFLKNLVFERIVCWLKKKKDFCSDYFGY